MTSELREERVQELSESAYVMLKVSHDALGELKGLSWLRSFVAYHFTRLYPGWAGWLPRHMPRLIPAARPPRQQLEPAYAGAKDKR